MSLVTRASLSLSLILRRSVRLQPRERMLVLFDTISPLARTLADAYMKLRGGSTATLHATDTVDEWLSRLPSQENLTLAVDVERVSTEALLQLLKSFNNRHDLVVCVQSGTFQHRLREYRLRLRLFEAGMKNIEHVHLGLISRDQEAAYVDALAFDPQRHGPVAQRLKKLLDRAGTIRVRSKGSLPARLAALDESEARQLAARVLALSRPPADGAIPSMDGACSSETSTITHPANLAAHTNPAPVDAIDAAAAEIGPWLEVGQPTVTALAHLQYRGGLEPCLINIGDFYQLHSSEHSPLQVDDTVVVPAPMPVGGTFPVGEVFSEAKSLEGVDGALFLWGYPSLQRTVAVAPCPFRVFVTAGVVVGVDPHAPLEFRQLLALVRDGEGGAVVMREFGLGLNPAMGSSRLVNDLVAFERQHGMHVSLGKKHTVFKKSAADRKKVAPAAAEASAPPAATATAPPAKRGQRRYGRFHMDVFVGVDVIEAATSTGPDLVTNVTIFRDGQYVL